ncbi:hypothetical protein O3G_MSEX004323 [Manduca sexta]|uniref:Peptidase S1 domain-containing protein n=1 Tax=Manduca sexta TaxID=7130 RepID=A0A921YUY2_MANSE|nr:hypothetical protein O3G_MSEX004323 [Manduca sexta]KAG6446129.1 hypothetical protein O3G_MSEX004323 [Manduca sexta]
MALHLLVALVLLAGTAHNSFSPEKSLLDINWDNIVAAIPGLVASIQEIVAGIEWANVLETIQNVINNLPAIIGNLPAIIENLPGDLPEIIGSLPDLIGSLPDVIGNLPEIIENINWDAILDHLPDIDWPSVIENLPDIVANLPEIIANLPDIIGNLPGIIENLPDIDWPAIIDLLPEIERDPGVISHISQHPSLVQIEVGYSSIWLMGCTGSILNTGYVLTAARCVSGRLYDPRIRRIRAGANSRGGDGVVYPVSYAIPHPSFGDNGFDGDIAVVRVLGVIHYGPNIQRVGITSQGVFFPAGVRVVNAGWGSTAQGKTISNRDLHRSDLYVVDHWQCANKFSQFAVPITVSHNMICAGRARSGGRMADLRDAGGPLYYDGTLVGVLSFGRYFLRDEYPVVATSVSSYTTWIVNTAV